MKLDIKHITKKYGDVAVLNNVSATLTPGIYGLLGANGAGKTTLFRIICGLMQPTQGEIRYNDENIEQHAENYRSILGYLPQEFSYYPDFTGLNFMLYIASLKGLNKRMARGRCLELLKQVGLDEVKNKKIRKYSGGMKQRLGIAQAMINDPEILVLDEPTVGLDPKERVKFRKLISSFATEKIVILSTHIVSDVEYIADRIIVLKGGRVINNGTIDDLLNEIQGHVWECAVSETEVDKIEQLFTVSNRKYENNEVILRIVALKKPTEKAKEVRPSLEDLYMFYFREVE